MSIEERKRLFEKLINAIQNCDKDEINKTKHDYLFYGSNLLDVIMNYITLYHNGIYFDFGHRTLKKGTKLYRVRAYQSDVDFSNPSQWDYPPHMPENRANRKGEPALYLGTTENVCLIETHIKKGDKYYLGEYVVEEDIDLGGFLYCEDIKKYNCWLAGVILNAFFIAPTRSDKNKEVFDFLDNNYAGLTPDDLQICEEGNIDLPLKFGFIYKKEKLYEITNHLIRPIKERYQEGLFYSSSFVPLSTIGIVCSDSNIVLYQSGIKKLKFIGSTLKSNKNEFNGFDLLKILAKT